MRQKYISPEKNQWVVLYINRSKIVQSQTRPKVISRNTDNINFILTLSQ